MTTILCLPVEVLVDVLRLIVCVHEGEGTRTGYTRLRSGDRDIANDIALTRRRADAQRVALVCPVWKTVVEGLDPFRDYVRVVRCQRSSVVRSAVRVDVFGLDILDTTPTLFAGVLDSLVVFRMMVPDGGLSEETVAGLGPLLRAFLERAISLEEVRWDSSDWDVLGILRDTCASRLKNLTVTCKSRHSRDFLYGPAVTWTKLESLVFAVGTRRTTNALFRFAMDSMPVLKHFAYKGRERNPQISMFLRSFAETITSLELWPPTHTHTEWPEDEQVEELKCDLLHAEARLRGSYSNAELKHLYICGVKDVMVGSFEGRDVLKDALYEVVRFAAFESPTIERVVMVEIGKECTGSGVGKGWLKGELSFLATLARAASERGLELLDKNGDSF